MIKLVDGGVEVKYSSHWGLLGDLSDMCNDINDRYVKYYVNNFFFNNKI